MIVPIVARSMADAPAATASAGGGESTAAATAAVPFEAAVAVGSMKSSLADIAAGGRRRRGFALWRERAADFRKASLLFGHSGTYRMNKARRACWKVWAAETASVVHRAGVLLVLPALIYVGP